MEAEMILNHFALFAGIDAEEALQWEPLCRGCAEEIRSKLRPGTDEIGNAERLSLAAAALANYRYELLQGAGSGTVKIGEISYTNGEREKIKDELLEMVGDLMGRGGVELIGVTIW